MVDINRPSLPEEKIESVRTQASEFMAMLDGLQIDVVPIRTEIQRLLDTITESQMSFRDLVATAKQLINTRDNVKRALSHEMRDETELTDSIKAVETEIKKMNEETDLSQEKLIELMKVLNERDASIAALEARKDLGSGWKVDQLHDKEALEAKRAQIQKDLDAQRTSNFNLRQEIDILKGQLDRFHSEKLSRDAKIHELKEMINDHRNKVNLQQKLKDEKERQLLDAKATVEHLTEEVRRQANDLEASKQGVRSSQEMLKRDRAVLERYTKENGRLERNISQYQLNIDDATRQSQKLNEQIAELERSIKTQREEAISTRREYEKTEKLAQLATTKSAALDERAAAVRLELAAARAKVDAAAAEHQLLQVELTAQRTRADSTRTERDAAQRLLTTRSGRSVDLLALQRAQADSARALENEIASHISSLRETHAQSTALDAERAATQRDLDSHLRALAAVADAVRLQELQAVALRRRIAEGELALAAQESAHEAARTAKAAHARALLVAQDEVARLRAEFAQLARQAETLKADVSAHDNALVRQNMDRHRVEKTKDQLKGELLRLHRQSEACVQLGVSQANEVARLTLIISESESELRSQALQLSAVRSEKLLLQQQANAMSGVVKTLYDRLRAQRGQLEAGSRRYMVLQEERNMYLAKIQKLTLDIALAKNKPLSIPDSTTSRSAAPTSEGGTETMVIPEDPEVPVSVPESKTMEDEDVLVKAITDPMEQIRQLPLNPMNHDNSGNQTQKEGNTLLANILSGLPLMVGRLNPAESREWPWLSTVLTSENPALLNQVLARLSNLLLVEQQRTRALTDELRVPLVVHRWRALEGSDPDRYRMLKKVHRLQKAVLDRREEVEKKRAAVARAQQELRELRERVKVVPSAEVFTEKHAALLNTLKTKQSQLKDLELEVKQARLKCEEYQAAVARLKQEQRIKKLQEKLDQRQKK